MVIKSDKNSTIRFASLQSKFGQAVITRHPILRNADSLVMMEISDPGGEVVHTRSTALLRIASHLGGVWSILLTGYILRAPLRDYFYDLFARYRYKLFGKYDACIIPSESTRQRFIDV